MLHIHNIDLHYHAGQERRSGLTLRDHLEYARESGRKVVGVTDHYGLYGWTHKEHMPYPETIEGLLQFRSETRSLQNDFPDIRIFWGPELGPRLNLDEVDDRVIAQTDFFILETPFDKDVEINTRKCIECIQRQAEFLERVGKPGFVAHPFRSVVNYRLIKGEVEEWVMSLEPRPASQFPEEMINRFFGINVREFGDACLAAGLSIEINGETHRRVRSSNNVAVLLMLRRAYGILKDQGVDFVPGSDQHSFMLDYGRIGRWIPFETFEYLGVGVEDLRFVNKLLA